VPDGGLHVLCGGRAARSRRRRSDRDVDAELSVPVRLATGHRAIRESLATAAGLLDASTAAERGAFWDDYTRFLERLADRDRRYLSFQLWQEGVARYVEVRAA